MKTVESEYRNSMLNLDEFVYQSSTVQSTHELVQLWTAYLQSDFRSVAYRTSVYPFDAVDSSDPFDDIADFNVVSKYTGWEEHYREMGYHRHDPLMVEQNVGNGPLVITEVFSRYDDPISRQIKSEIREFGRSVEGIVIDMWAGPGKVLGTRITNEPGEVHMDAMVRRKLPAALQIFYASLQDVRALEDTRSAQRDRLTPRERDVLNWVARGFTKAEIAEKLGMSLSTVKRHCEHINLKIGATNMAQAVARAIAWGEIAP